MHERDVHEDPIPQLRGWLDEASELRSEPLTMTLATATPDGAPSARIVLLRELDERGLTFFTNRGSRKGLEIAENPRAALVLHSWELGRQVRIEGAVEELSDEESEAYWQTRPRGSQLAAWASRQSRHLVNRAELESRVAEVERRYAGDTVPRPPFWGGYRVVPESIEFWTHRDNRLHDRNRHVLTDDGWRREQLAP
jgi:pyridoxamine 5'-phosphate oxidase